MNPFEFFFAEGASSGIGIPIWWWIIGVIIVEVTFAIFIWMHKQDVKGETGLWFAFKIYAVFLGVLIWFALALVGYGLFWMIENGKLIWLWTSLGVIFSVIIYFLINYYIAQAIVKVK